MHHILPTSFNNHYLFLMFNRKNLPGINISVPKAAYTDEELKSGIQVSVAVTGTLPKGTYFIVCSAENAEPNIANAIPVTIKDKQCNIALGPALPEWDKVPWSGTDAEDRERWSIHFAQKNKSGLTSLAQTTISVAQLAPVITALIYQTGSLQVTWNPRDYTDFIVTLTDSGQSKQNQLITGSTTTFQQTLNPSDTYTVQVTAMVNDAPGPASSMRTAIVAAPVYTQLKYSLFEGTGILDSSWTAITGAAKYITTIQASDGSFKTNVPSVSTTSQLIKSLDPLVDYTAFSTGMSADGVVMGPAGTAISAVVAQPVVSHLGYELTNANGTLSSQWGAVNLADQYTTTITSTDGSYNQSFPSDTTSVNINQTLDPAKTYTVVTAGIAQSGVVIGPDSDALAPLLIAPVVKQLQYTLPQGSGQLLTSWGDIVDATSYMTTVKASDGSYLKNILSTDPSSELLQTLDPALSYQVTVISMTNDGVITGPSSDPLNAIIAQPVFTLIHYALSSGNGVLQNEWNAVLNAETYITNIKAADGSYTGNVISEVPQSILNKNLSDATTYSITVSSVSNDGVVTGPASDPIQPLTEVPALNIVAYNLMNTNGSLTSDWNAIQAADGYITTVKATDGSLLKNSISQQPTSTIAITLNSALTYTAQVVGMADNGVVIGPESNIVTVLQSMPADAYVTYDGTALNSTWTADANPQCTGYIAELLKDDAAIQSNNTTTTDFIFPGQMSDGCIYAVQIRSTGTNVMGPWCEQAFAPYATQVIYSYDQLGRLLEADADGAFSYQYTFSDQGNIETATATTVTVASHKN